MSAIDERGMKMSKEKKEKIVAAVKKYCDESPRSMFGIVVFISFTYPDCTVTEAVNIALWAHECGWVER